MRETARTFWLLSAILGILSGCVKAPPPNLDFSGLAAVEPGHVLVVHDTKCQFTSIPHLGLLTLTPGISLRPRAVAVDWSDFSRPGNDLESVCALPGKKGEFLMCESGYVKLNDGREFRGFLYHIRLLPGHKGRWTAKILKRIEIPRELRQVEGIACPPQEGGNTYLVILAERGSGGQGGSNLPGRLHWARLNLDGGPGDKPGLALMGKVDFWAPGVEWDQEAEVRYCSDIYVDEQNRLWIAATQDPGDTGPFRSAVFLAGRVVPGENPPILLDPVPYLLVPGFKIEALTAAPGSSRGKNRTPAVFIIGTDDEDFGGTWRFLPFPGELDGREGGNR